MGEDETVVAEQSRAVTESPKRGMVVLVRSTLHCDEWGYESTKKQRERECNRLCDYTLKEP